MDGHCWLFASLLRDSFVYEIRDTIGVWRVESIRKGGSVTSLAFWSVRHNMDGNRYRIALARRDRHLGGQAILILLVEKNLIVL